MEQQAVKPRRENQLQGPRPAPLRINKKDSHQIRKLPIASNLRVPHAPAQVPNNQPVIIYSVSPEPIHVDPSNFMSIVQKLTGKDSNFTYSSSSSRAGDAPHSPAAMERTSPTEKETRERYRGDLGEEMNNVEVGSIQGILSPEPVDLPGITPDMFAPVNDGFGFGLEPSDWFNMSPLMGNSNASSPTPPGADFFKFEFS